MALSGSRRRILKVQVFVSGAAIMALEIMSSRLLAPYWGSSLYVWGSLIGVTLTGLAIGYYYGGRRSESNPSHTGFSLLILSAGVYVLLLAVASPTIFWAVIAMRIGERLGPLVACMIVLGPPSIILGMVSPYSVKLVAESLGRVGTTAGTMYSLSTVGSIIGTFLTAFVLVPELGITTILYGLALVMILTSLLGLSLRWRMAAVPAIILIVASPALSPAPATGVLVEKETLYHHLVVQDDTLSGIRTLILDNNLHSATDLRDPNRIVYKYTGLFHLGLSYNPNATKALFIGGGGFSGPKRFLSDYPWMQVDVVEIDPDVVNVAREYFNVQPDPRLRVYVEDGRTYLSRTAETYDVVAMDAYSRTYVPFHLMTREYLELVAGRLSEDGVLVSNLISSLEGRTSDLFRAELKTQRTVFPSVDVYPVSTAQGTTVQNLIVVATRTRSSPGQLVANSGIVRIPEIGEWLGLIYSGMIPTDDVPVLTDDYAPVEVLLNPLTGEPYGKETLAAGNSDSYKTILSPEPSPSPPSPLVGLLAAVLIASLVLSLRQTKTDRASVA